MTAENVPLRVDKIAGQEFLPGIAGEEGGVIAVRDKADILTVGLGRDGQTRLCLLYTSDAADD